MIKAIRVQAKWIHSVSEPVISNGIVEISDGIVIAIRKSKTPESNSIDLGPVSLIPGLINAHTHLEFSNLDRPLGKVGMAFTDWIRLVVAQRSDSQSNAAAKSHAIKLGIRESIESGVIAIGDIATDPMLAEDYGDEIVATIFHERLGRHPDRVRSTVERAGLTLEAFRNGPKQQSAVSPHAPYSVHPDLLAASIKQAQQLHCPLAMHLAETREELQLLRDQTGPFVELLQSLDAWHPETFRSGTTILDYLKLIAQAPRSIVVHGNYLSASEIEFIAQHRTKMSVVYCPRTHDFFHHDDYPLNKLLDARINVAVGTDSRASNPDLNLYRELQMIQQKFPSCESGRILELGTREGALAIGIESEFGTIKSSPAAHLNVVDSDTIQNLFSPTATCVPLARYLQKIGG